jgi:hypothetical protein
MSYLSAGASVMRVRRALALLLYVAILTGSVQRLREAFVHNPLDELYSDPLRHWDHARQILSVGPWAVIDPPIFQMWLSLVQKWSLEVPVLVGTYAGLLSTITPWLWYRFLRDSLSSRLLALVGWAAFAWLPSWTGIYSYFMTETLLLPLLGASLWLTVRADRKCTVPSFCAMTALWTLTGLTRGIGVPLGGMAGLWVWLRQPEKMRKAAWSSLIVLMMMAPFAIRNYEYFKLWSPIGTGWPIQIYAESGQRNIHLDLTRGTNSWGYDFGSPSMYAKQLAPLSDWDSSRVGTVSIAIDMAKGPVDWQSAYTRNAVHGWRSIRLRWENLILVMLGISWPDSNSEWLVARNAIAMRWVWAPLFLLILGWGAVRYRTTLARPLVPILIATWFVFQAVSLVSVNEGRYRKPLEGLLIAELLVLLDGGAAASSRQRNQRKLLVSSSFETGPSRS